MSGNFVYDPDFEVPVTVDLDWDMDGGNEAPLHTAEVDAFLSTIQLPIPMSPPRYDYRPSYPVILKPQPIKQWAWTGRLTICPESCPQPETICEKAILSDPTELAERHKPRLASFVLSKKDLNFIKYYDVADLPLILPSYQPAQQFARLFSEGEDNESLGIFVEYMTRKELAALIPALWDEDELLGHIFFVPHNANTLLAALGVPQYLCQPGCLVAALLFLAPVVKFPDRRPPGSLLGPRASVERALMSKAHWHMSMLTDPAYHFALRITGLSADVREFASAFPSIVWPGPIPSIIGDQDTRYLHQALCKCRAGIVDAVDAPGTNVGAVFIHVGALHLVHTLPHLAALRRRPWVRFFQYGTHPCVPHACWGVREIFGLGGVVTFTPTALARDPWGVLRTIRNVDAHPLWDCYLLPQVLGLAVRMFDASCEGEKYLDLLHDPCAFAFECILDAVLEGQVALMCAPGGEPQARDPDPALRWALENVWFRPVTKPTLHKRCSDACDAAFPSNMWAAEARAKKDIYADMRRMQAQPALMSSYRRFVVLDMQWAKDTDGIEWDVVGKLDFNDDFLRDDAVTATGIGM
ncbi:hypothetical protein B0H11DRAFT_1985430 [Mycena galericulata]|nr:hypothetical protein B0H11DRAFT_1985430 [Mycena galericulata]